MHTDQQIDDVILAQTDAKFLKVAMILGRVSKILNRNDNEFFERVVSRIKWLCDNGQLEGMGDLSLWRHSEIRLPPQ